MNFSAILPELVLTLGAIVLMMIAALGRRTAGFTTWAAVAVLVGACFALLGEPQNAGPLFGGLIVADGFGAFGKLICFLSAAVAIIAAHGWFERDFEHGEAGADQDRHCGPCGKAGGAAAERCDHH